jgi:hypothetical protein
MNVRPSLASRVSASWYVQTGGFVVLEALRSRHDVLTIAVAG